VPGLSPEQFSEHQQVHRKRIKESDLVGKKGYERKYNPDGTYRWRYKYPVNDRGKPARAFSESVEMMAPYNRGAAEFYQKHHAGQPKAALLNHEGQTRLVEPALADQTARRTGWSHRWRAGGSRVESGPGGMLFRQVRGGWEPIGEGRWCLGTPLTTGGRPRCGKKDGAMLRLYPQMDPDGEVWEWTLGEWQRC
jgi:hypothetical protein